MGRVGWVVLAGLWAVGVRAEEPHTGGTVVTVLVAGLSSERGQVECVLWAGPAGFPSDVAKAASTVRTGKLERSGATCVFESVPPGTFAVSLIHDENGNGHIDKNFLGIPTERYGFSNNPSPMMRAPRFDEASFQVAGTPVSLRVVVR